MLSDDDRARLHVFLHRGMANARSLTRARVLLKAGEGWSDAELVEAFDVCANIVTNVRARFTDGGLEAVLQDKRQACRRQAEKSFCRSLAVRPVEVRLHGTRSMRWRAAREV